MNEQLRNLADYAQAMAVDDISHLERVHNRRYSATELNDIYTEKLAELLIRECANVDFCKAPAGLNEEQDYAVSKMILSHFEVHTPKEA